MNEANKLDAAAPVVRIFCDYSAEGVWGYPLLMLYEDDLYSCSLTDKEADIEAFESLGWSEDFRERSKDWVLLRELEQWNEQYDHWYWDWEHSLAGDSPVPDIKDFDPDAFTETGKQLAFRMKQHHPDWVVTFLDEVASDRVSHYSDESVHNADSFWYIVETGDNGEMLLIPCEWEEIDNKRKLVPKSLT